MIRSAVLCLDQGGHSSRAVIYGNDGTHLASAAVPVSTRRDGATAEHDSDEIVASLVTAAHRALGKIPAQLPVTSAGLATQRSTMLCWDRIDGRPLSPTISWQDRRGEAYLPHDKPTLDILRRITGLRPNAHYGVLKYRACLDAIPAVARALRDGRLRWGPLASYLARRLTDDHTDIADPVNASRTLLWSLHDRNWSPRLLDLFAVPASTLPPAAESLGAFGRLRVGTRRIPLACVTGDQAAVPWAAGRPTVDTVYLNLGTGAFLLRPLRKTPPETGNLLLSPLPTDQAPAMALEGTVNSAGAALTWAAAELFPRDQPPGLEDWEPGALSAPYFINGVSGLGSPDWIPDLPSRFDGPGSPAERHFAVAESIAFLVRRNLDVMARCVGTAPKAVATGGLARSNRFCQVLADLMARPLQRPGETEATARGLATLLGVSPETPGTPPATLFLPSDRAEALECRYATWTSLLEVDLGNHHNDSHNHV